MRKQTITGYSRFTCDLRGLHYRSPEEKENIPNLTAGKFCALSREVHNTKDPNAVAVYHNGYQMGYVESVACDIVSDIMRSNKYELCQITDRYAIDGQIDAIVLSIYYKEEGGTIVLPSRDGPLDWWIVDADNYIGEIDDNYLAVMETYEFINRKLSWYGVTGNDLSKISVSLLLQINEDDRYLKLFIHEYNRGVIFDKADKTKFVRDATELREHGDSRILSKRISHYLDHKGFELS